MIATGTSMTKTQNESCLETLLQFVGFLGVLFGICIGIYCKLAMYGKWRKFSA